MGKQTGAAMVAMQITTFRFGRLIEEGMIIWKHSCTSICSAK